MKEIMKEAGRTVRFALLNWGLTVRLCLIIAVVASAWMIAHH